MESLFKMFKASVKYSSFTSSVMIAILAGLLNNLGDTYLTCSEYACDIRKNTWSVSYLQTEEETGISILNIFHWKFFVAGADMKIRMFFNDMSWQSDVCLHHGHSTLYHRMQFREQIQR